MKTNLRAPNEPSANQGNAVARNASRSAVFLRWAGGKRWLVPTLRTQGSSRVFHTYFEPFLGGGSLFLEWGYSIARQFVLSDLESPLIEVYKAVRDIPEDVLSYVHSWSRNQKQYLAVREFEPNGDPAFNAARLVYLNRHAWNGLYRVNRDGHFNVPYAPRKPMPSDFDSTVREASKRLKETDATLEVSDFESIIKRATAGDVLVLDPPYAIKSIGSTKNRYYNVKRFSWDDQERLAKAAKDAAIRGVKVFATPGAGAEGLYSHRVFSFVGLRRNQQIAGDPKCRSRVPEWLIISRD